MKVSSTLLLCAFFIGSIEALVISENVKVNCFIDHLKDKYILEENFPKLPGSLAENCDELIKDFNKTLIEKVLKEGTENKKCIEDELFRYKFAETFMQQIVNETSTSQRVSEQISKENLKRSSKSLIKSVFFCDYSKHQELFSLSKQHIGKLIIAENSTLSYCLRKYVKDNNLIDPDYNIYLNPGDNEITSETCTSYLSKFKDIDDNSFTFISTDYFNERSKNCVIRKASEAELSKKYLYFVVFKELGLTDELELRKHMKLVRNMESEMGKECFQFE